jgi:hypothetical protein
MLSLGLHLGVGSPRVRSGFALTDISGLQAWYKFNTLHTLDGGALASWGDSSGNGHTLTNTGATNKRPSVENNGRVDWGDVPSSFMDIQNGSVPNSRPYTVIVVVEHEVVLLTKISRYLNGSSSSSSVDTISWGTLGSTTNQLWQSLLAGFSDSTSRISTSQPSGKLVNNTKTISIFRYGGGSTDGDTSFTIETVADGGSLTQVHNTTAANSNDEVLNCTAVGLNSTNQYIQGYMDEMCIWNRRITGNELTEVIADLKARHNMT